MKRIINVAIIAHVDAGKSTLVDALLAQSGVFDERDIKIEQIMDSNDLERERGITIYSKNCSIIYKDIKINIVDTPGHADFSGEVERIMKNVDTVILLVDSSEGPMPQTRFVLKKSLEHGLNPILLINKIDKPSARSKQVVDLVLELFMELEANDVQMEFPVLYGSAKYGIVKYELSDESTNLIPLFETLIKHVPPYPYTKDDNLQLQITSLKYDDYLGRIGIGRIHKGEIFSSQKYSLINKNGTVQEVKFANVFVNKGLGRQKVEHVNTGDIIQISGIPQITIGDTISSLNNPQPMAKIEIEEPTITMNFLVNKSPFAGREGKYVTSRNIKERLVKELETNVSLRIQEIPGIEGFKVDGRGELHLSILIENMRREGFELAISKPQVLYKIVNGQRHEPYEEAQVTCDDNYVGTIIQQFADRKGTVVNMYQAHGQTTIIFNVPSRGLIGYRQKFITTTRGTGILEKSFLKYDKYAGDIKGRLSGVLVSTTAGATMAFALWKISERGKLFIGPQTKVYEGMIIGIHAKTNDLDVNPIKNKQLSNVRSSGSDDAIRVPTPIKFNLEESLEFIAHDELVEVTPLNIRMRKKVLQKKYRK